MRIPGYFSLQLEYSSDGEKNNEIIYWIERSMKTEPIGESSFRGEWDGEGGEREGREKGEEEGTHCERIGARRMTFFIHFFLKTTLRMIVTIRCTSEMKNWIREGEGGCAHFIQSLRYDEHESGMEDELWEHIDKHSGDTPNLRQHDEKERDDEGAIKNEFTMGMRGKEESDMNSPLGQQKDSSSSDSVHV